MGSRIHRLRPALAAWLASSCGLLLAATLAIAFVLVLHRFAPEIVPARRPNLPPWFEGEASLFMAVVWAQMVGALLLLEWGWRVGWSFKERPRAWNSPVTLGRLIIALILVSIAFRMLPDVVGNMRWSAIDGPSRLWWARADQILNGVSLIPFSGAWLLAYIGGAVVDFQLDQRPLPRHLWPSVRQMLRPLGVGVGVAVVAFAITYLEA